jgi:hypothetical protein
MPLFAPSLKQKNIKMKKTLLTMIACGAMMIANAQFFDATDYVGAFGKTDWTANWANFDPDNTAYPATNAVLEGDITTNTTLDASKTYLLKGFVYVKNNATLTIPAGTVIRGDKVSKATLIITKGAKLNANGESGKPIVFTSNQGAGSRDYGDWGGIIVLGKATMNASGGTGTIEGGVNNSNNDGEYGGSDDADNSGSITFVRVEFPGIAFQPNNEINGVTFGGVGTGTVVHHLQVSYSGDDAIEWFGGSVDCKYLITYRSFDDDYDCDAGYHGRVQFGFTLRDPNVADASGSNGFEIDNDGSGSTNTPITSPTFSNITLLGPKATNSTFDNLYKRAAHHRRNSELSIFNSVLVGYPLGWYLDGANTYDNVNTGKAEFKNNIFACNDKTWDTTKINQSTFDLGTFAKNGTNNNIEQTTCDLGLTDIKLVNPNPLPKTTSVVWGKQSFTSPKFGAVGVAKLQLINTNIYPNPANKTINITVENNDVFTATLTDLNGKVMATTSSTFDVSSVANGIYVITVQTSKGTATTKIVVNH